MDKVLLTHDISHEFNLVFQPKQKQAFQYKLYCLSTQCTTPSKFSHLQKHTHMHTDTKPTDKEAFVSNTQNFVPSTCSTGLSCKRWTIWAQAYYLRSHIWIRSTPLPSILTKSFPGRLNTGTSHSLYCVLHARSVLFLQDVEQLHAPDDTKRSLPSSPFCISTQNGAFRSIIQRTYTKHLQLCLTWDLQS